MSINLDTFLPYRLNRLAEAVSDDVRPIYKERFGLNRPEWRVLAALGDLGRATATQIGAHSAQHKTKVSRAVWALEQRRWLKREIDPSDRRSEFLSLTPSGQSAYCELTAPMRKGEGNILAKLTAEDRDALDRGLTALEAIFGYGADKRI